MSKEVAAQTTSSVLLQLTLPSAQPVTVGNNAACTTEQSFTIDTAKMTHPLWHEEAAVWPLPASYSCLLIFHLVPFAVSFCAF